MDGSQPPVRIRLPLASTTAWSVVVALVFAAVLYFTGSWSAYTLVPDVAFPALVVGGAFRVWARGPMVLLSHEGLEVRTPDTQEFRGWDELSIFVLARQGLGVRTVDGEVVWLGVTGVPWRKLRKLIHSAQERWSKGPMLPGPEYATASSLQLLQRFLAAALLAASAAVGLQAIPRPHAFAVTAFFPDWRVPLRHDWLVWIGSEMALAGAALAMAWMSRGKAFQESTSLSLVASVVCWFAMVAAIMIGETNLMAVVHH